MEKALTREEYYEWLTDQWEMLTYCEEETNPRKDYAFEHEWNDNEIPF